MKFQAINLIYPNKPSHQRARSALSEKAAGVTHKTKMPAILTDIDGVLSLGTTSKVVPIGTSCEAC